MNEHEAERIAAAMHQLRPDWPRSSLLTLIRKSLMDRPRRDVVVALAWVASEPGTSTPARVLESGPWWRAAGVEGTVAPRKGGPICAHCGLEESDCGRRWAGDHTFVTAAEWENKRRRDADARADALEYAKQALGDAKAEGITPPPGREHKVSAHVEALRAELPDAPPVAPEEPTPAAEAALVEPEEAAR